MFIGQKKLHRFLEEATLQTLPQSLLLIGDKGCGKHTFCNELKNKLQVSSMELDDKFSDETVNDLFNICYPTLCFIDVDNFSPNAQNSLLKVLEEPPVYCYFILICNNISGVIPTLLNRCKQWRFEGYSKMEMYEFIEDDMLPLDDADILIEIAKTPGKLKELQSQSYKEMIDLSTTIVEKIGNASISNTLTIGDKIAFKNEKDKFDFDTFIQILKYVLVRKIKNEPNPHYINMYSTYLAFDRQLTNTLSKQRLFDNLIIKLWEVARA